MSDARNTTPAELRERLTATLSELDYVADQTNHAEITFTPTAAGGLASDIRALLDKAEGAGRVETALRRAFPHFSGEETITPERVLGIGREYEGMVLGWEPSKSEIEFHDQNGEPRTIVFELGEDNHPGGWILPDDAGWSVWTDAALAETEREAEAAEAQAQALREALKAAEKFVPTYEPWMDAWADEDECGFTRRGATFGDLRKVRSALSQGGGNVG